VQRTRSNKKKADEYRQDHSPPERPAAQDQRLPDAADAIERRASLDPAENTQHTFV
jgi:hypothetical protein